MSLVAKLDNGETINVEQFILNGGKQLSIEDRQKRLATVLSNLLGILRTKGMVGLGHTQGLLTLEELGEIIEVPFMRRVVATRSGFGSDEDHPNT